MRATAPGGLFGVRRGGHHALVIDPHDRGERGLQGTLGDLLGGRAGSDRRRVSARSPIVADIAARRSDATVTATPSSRAAVKKSGAR